MKQMRFKRSIALMMTACIIGTMVPPPILAYATETNSDVIEIANFISLEESVRVRNVPLGTSLADLGLPSELTATTYNMSDDMIPVLPPKEDKPNDSGQTDIVPDKEQPAQSEPLPPTETESGETTPEPLLPNEEKSDIKPEKAVLAEVIKTVLINNITWESTPIYNEQEIGEYIFTAVLPEQYVLAEGVAMPEIVVTVSNNTKVINSWTWNDPEGYLTEGVLALPGVNAENPVDLTALTAMLPVSINATVDDVNTPIVQENDDTVTTPTAISLKWSSDDFVQAEDKSFPTHGEFTFTATMEDGYTLSENAPPLKITVQLGGAMLLPSVGVFSRLEIREISAEGDIIVNLLDPTSISGDWKLEVDKDYYLCAGLPQNSDITHIRLRYGNNAGTANGVTFANPPDGKYEEGVIKHDYLSKLSKRDNFPEIDYGSPKKEFALGDGVIEYEIKNDLPTGTTISIAMGLVVKDELSVGGIIHDAVSISAGKQVGGVFTATPTASHNIDIKMADKVSFINRFDFNSGIAQVGYAGSAFTYRPFSTHTGSTIAFLYEKLECDVTYPKDTTLSVGFNQDVTTSTNPNHGTIRLDKAKTDPTNPDMLVSHITIGPGWKAKNDLTPIYMKLKFSENSRFQSGQKHTLTVSPTIITVDGVEMKSTPADNGNIATYTLIDSNDDLTTITGSERTVYNNTIDMGVGARYHIPLGTTVIKNTHPNNPSPFDKTFEAQYNTGNTAANISRIIVPIGSNAKPTITWEGIASDGSPKNGTVPSKDLTKYMDKKDWASSAYLLLPVEDFGIVSFTSVKAEIGKLRPVYNRGANINYSTYLYNICSAFGYFTTDEPGLVVRNTFRIYNTKVEEQSLPNGDISAEGVAISTDWCGMAVVKYENITLNGTKFNTESAVSGGGVAIIKGELLPYELPLSAYHPDAPESKGTTAFVTDPVFYLTLPQGLTLVSENLKFQQKSVTYLGGDEETTVIKHTIENVSYLNTTGDGVSIYKVTFPDDQPWGSYDGNNRKTTLTYEIQLLTSKSLTTQRYRLNDLVSVTTKKGITALMRNGKNEGIITFVNEDKYGLNDGKPMTGIAGDTTANPIGFAVQQQAEINVYNAVAVTKIDGQTVPERWYSYDVSDPNSIAMLGRNSEGRLRLRVSNTSETEGKDFAMILPLPKEGIELGDVFMDKPPEFTLAMTYDAKTSNDKFTAKYIKLSNANDKIPSAGVNGLTYMEVSEDQANAVLLTADSIPKGDFDIYLNFKLSDGTPKAMNIWRPAYSYSLSSGRHSNYGSYVASSVAGSGITGVVWNDVNRNGQKDVGESGVGDVTIVAKDEQNRILSTNTAVDGSYTFLAVRESKIDLNFITDNDKNLRFNVQPLGNSATKTVSTVLPDASGLQATKSLNASGAVETVNAAMSGFITLKYNANEGIGNLPKTAEYISGAVATVAVKPDNLVKTGYRFVEWNTKADGSGIGYQSGNTLTITENVTLYAIWEIASYTITFNYRGATSGNDEASRVRQHGTQYGELPVPTKVGYEFNGWMDSSAGTTANVMADTEFITGRDTTVYALWTAKTGFKVKYNTHGDNLIGDTTVTWIEQVLPSSKPVRQGYDFVEWRHKDTTVLVSDTFGNLSDSDADGAFITLDAVWKAKTGYIVQYDLQGGTATAITDKTVTWTDKNLLPSANPTKVGNAFAGWKLGTTTTEVTNSNSYGDLAGKDTVKSITLVAQWVKIIGNVVSYDTDGGTPVNDKVNVLDSDTNLLPTPTPTKHGYTLEKWVVSGETPEKIATDSSKYSELSSTTTLTLKAVWKEKDYTIKYQPNNTTNINDKTPVKWNDSNLLPTAPTKKGYTFAGWYFGDVKVESSTTVKTLIPNDDAQNDTLTLIAHWTEQTYLVQYDSVGGGNFTPKPNVKYTASSLSPDTSPAKEGYTFTGWYVGNKKVEPATSCSELLTNPTSSSVTLVAKWEVKTGFTVKYNTAGGTKISDKSPVKWTDTSLLPTTPPTRNGYDFNGWTVGRTPVTATTVYASIAESDQAGTSVTLVANWKEKQGFKVKYSTGDGGTIINDATVLWGGTVFPSIIPTRTNYIFGGWIHNKTPITAASKYSELAEKDTIKEITLTAVWIEKDNYKVTYNTDGGSEVTDKIKVKWTDTNLIPSDNPTKKGYTFVEWQYNGKKVESTNSYGSLAIDDTVMSIELKAVWTENSNYTVNYDTNGASTITAKTGVKWTDIGLLPSNNPTYDENHAFVEWQYKGKKVESTDSYASLADLDTTLSITLKVIWAETSDNIVKYNTGDGGTSYADKSNVKISDKNLLPTPDPTRNGYQFNGWKAGDKVVTNDTVYSAITTEKILTLTAQWIEKSYTISYDVIGYNSIQKKWTENNLLPNTDPKQDGYTFTGWYYNDTKVETSAKVSDLIPLDESNTLLLKAGWNKNSITGSQISGIVKDEDGNLVKDAKVRLTQGSTTIYGPNSTNAQGEYLISNIKSGIYNLVAEKDGQTVTVIVTIAKDTLKQDLILPVKKKNSVLVVTGKDTPSVVVGNLDEVAKNTTLEGGNTSLTIKLTVQKEAEKTAGKEAEHDQIRSTAGTNAEIVFLDAQLTKTVDSNPPVNIGDSNNVVLEVVIPFNLTGKKDIKVYRYHDSVNAFKQLSNKPIGVFEDGTYYVNNNAGLIHVYAEKYSTYAISYRTDGGGEDLDGGGNSSDIDPEYDFWMEVKDEIKNANSGDVIKINAKDLDKMPWSVMEELRKNGDTSLVITWNGGKTITIPAGMAQANESGRIYWPLSKLAELYANINELTVLKPVPAPSNQINPPTGGPIEYVAVGGGKTVEVEAPKIVTAEPQATTITKPDAGFEPDAFVNTPDEKAVRTGVNPITKVTIAMLLALIAGGFWLWKSREEN